MPARGHILGKAAELVRHPGHKNTPYDNFYNFPQAFSLSTAHLGLSCVGLGRDKEWSCSASTELLCAACGVMKMYGKMFFHYFAVRGAIRSGFVEGT